VNSPDPFAIPADLRLTQVSGRQLDRYWPNYIDGKYCHGGAGSIDVKDPSCGETLAAQALADAADVDRAVQAARRVYLSGALANLHPMERGRMVRKMGQYLASNIEEIKRTLILEQGKPWFEADVELKATIRLFEYFGSIAESLDGRSVPTDGTRFAFTVYRPFGVSAQFLPSHYPIYIPARSLAVALVTGNSCVLKTSELTPISATWFARAAEDAGLPAGAVNIICGRGVDAGQALAAHPDIDHLVFSGHVETASKVLTAAGANLIPSVVEVGGTNPTIVFEDADLDAFESEARTGSFWNAGQFCGGMYRVIVHESRHQELIDRSVALAESLRLVPGIESPRTQAPVYGPYMGPLDSEKQVENVIALVEEAKRSGAKCLTGGARAPGPGSFMQPTVLRDVRSEMRIAQKEVWGPVMAVMKFKEIEEAFQIANSTPYTGLLCAVFTQDLGTMTRSAHEVRAGHVVTNASIVSGPEISFGGGFGRTGYGRVKGRDALLSYVQAKNVLLPIGDLLPETSAQAKAWIRERNLSRERKG